MTKKQVLGFKPRTRLEHSSDQHSEHLQDREHRSQRCNDSALWCQSISDGIFGYDSNIHRLADAERHVRGAGYRKTLESWHLQLPLINL
jgi:hypothetical protein